MLAALFTRLGAFSVTLVVLVQTELLMSCRSGMFEERLDDSASLCIDCHWFDM